MLLLIVVLCCLVIIRLASSSKGIIGTRKEQLDKCRQVAKEAFPLHLFHENLNEFYSPLIADDKLDMSTFAQLYYECIKSPTVARLEILRNFDFFKPQESILDSFDSKLKSIIPEKSLIATMLKENYNVIVEKLKVLNQEIDKMLLEKDIPIVIEEKYSDFTIEFAHYPQLKIWVYTIKRRKRKKEEGKDDDIVVIAQEQHHDSSSLIHSLKKYISHEYIHKDLSPNFYSFYEFVKLIHQKKERIAK